MIKKILGFGVNIPYLGEFKVKTLVRSVVIGVGAGALVYGLSRIPVVGPYIQAGLAKIAPFQIHRQS